ncbi:GNAT family N-acetyltransferase [Roseinatronobacter bogoriensis]|uniref:N-acetyltransferase n=1 Tax=Roseinatronobacter bogoriensis subsp. barguzinensis TaxID=441209 RepID=A0A2K8KEG8_9RHOB|nr:MULTISPECIES: GNAT family N-acetyltransferase [Rhodobaca]ATX67822.1 N-acetyltransferase [Rhodobaca barguzinensis]MBB4207183.1 phosphinothricin acetyltransferase [Rhodobaca bogoriensis DSM 18756]TDW40447.1 phosphinothricin acetyltransferase [Rhodobaca barguzinensis]TDY70401.1 phosphinothricin acetyltransferase [Rhodobaca bogoriensis DSM 18756]
MPALTLRDATPDDAAAIVAIWNPIIQDTVVTFNPVLRSTSEIEDMIVSRQAGGHAFIVAQDAEDVLGFASYAQFRGGLGYARSMEHTINLSPAARGKGAGRALLLELERHATAAGHHIMVAAVTGTNSASISFHHKLGYVHVGTMPQVGWKFGQFHDLVLMQKFL